MDIAVGRSIYTSVAKSLEKEFSLAASVVEKNPLIERDHSMLENHVLYLIVPPEKRNVLGKRKFIEKTSGINVVILDSESSIADEIRSTPGGLDAGISPPNAKLNPVLFHTIIYGQFIERIRKDLQTTFGKEINEILRWNQEWAHKKVQREMKEQHEDRMKDLGKMAQEIMSQRATLLVALDRSGRTVGIAVRTAIKVAYGVTIPLVFINPAPIKNKTITREDLEEFSRQVPRLAQRLRGARVIIVDDTIISGKTTKKVKELIKAFGAESVYESILGRKPITNRGMKEIYFGVQEKEGQYLTRGKKMSVEERRYLRFYRGRMHQLGRDAGHSLRRRR
ncbi:MAG: phosphoribosyltransferase family protein [archaeon]